MLNYYLVQFIYEGDGYYDDTISHETLLIKSKDFDSACCIIITKYGYKYPKARDFIDKTLQWKEH